MSHDYQIKVSTTILYTLIMLLHFYYEIFIIRYVDINLKNLIIKGMRRFLCAL